MNFVWFKDLGHLALTRNFSQAAELSNLSQPAFSRRIRAIEGWVGVTLVDRSKHPVSLTTAGLQMLEAGQQALARLETERAQILDSHTLPDQYVVTFGAQHSIGWRFYPSWLHAFENAFGPIISRLRADDLLNCLADLESGEVDFVIAYASGYASSIDDLSRMDSVVIGEDQLVAVCKRRPDGQPLFDLRHETAVQLPYLQFGANAPISRHIEPLLAEYDLNRRLSVVYENSMAGALRIRARKGTGIAWLPKSLIAPDLENGLLTLAGDPSWSVKLEIRLYRLRGQTNQLTRAIWAYLCVREPVPLLGES